MLCTLTPDKLSAVSYDPLSHCRHNGGDRSVKVGHEIIWDVEWYETMQLSSLISANSNSENDMKSKNDMEKQAFMDKKFLTNCV